MEYEKTFVGIDPGVSGGIAIREKTGEIKLYAMPDPYTDCVHIFKELDPKSTEVYLEQLNGFMGGSLPASRIGVLMENYGFLQGGLYACGLPTHKIVPAKWQQAIGAGSRSKQMSRTEWKNKIKRIVSQKHPTLKITLATSDALGILDFAILINNQNTQTQNGTI